MAGSSTTLVDPLEESFSSSGILSSSLGRLSSPRKTKSEVSKTYKQASELFLTRQLSEALSTIEPLITVPQSSEEITEESETPRRAPIAGASRNSRIKVWVFYLTLLNAIADLGAEKGSATFGSKAWKNIYAKIQDGSIWDEVTDTGYGGIEGKIDPDVVVSLATLLLAQSTSQKSNQQHLETFLSSSNDPILDLRDPLEASQSLDRRTDGGNLHNNGANTPRDLNSRVNIIELYTLHVLPRNGEWEYAKDFINMSEVLDEEVREGFLQDLQILEDEESKGEEDFEDAVPQQEDKPMPRLDEAEETERESIDTVRQAQPLDRHRSNSETDYGIEESQCPLKAEVSHPPPRQPAIKPVKSPQLKSSRSPPTKIPRKPASASIYQTSKAAMTALQKIVSRLTAQLSHNPMGLFRFVLFLVGLITALSQRNVKERVGALTRIGWDKVKRTVGMGVKVSYI